VNFDYSEEQQLIADSVQRFVAQDYAFDARRAILASETGTSPAAWKTMADIGLIGMALPAEHGGFGGNALDLMSVMEAFGAALVVEPYLSTVMGAQFVARGGSPAQKSEILPAVAEGRSPSRRSRRARAMTSPTSPPARARLKAAT
jgi:alkylation response protein AidB-like acyl-CoA dehydrogenase